MKPNVMFMTLLLISVFSLSACKNNPVRKNLADPNSSYYMGIRKAAAQLDGDEEAVKFYSNPKNAGLNYYDIQRKNKQFIAQEKRQRKKVANKPAEKKSKEATKLEIAQACKVGNIATTGFTGLTMLANALVSLRKGESVAKGAARGHKLANKEVWVKGVKYSCP